MRQSCSFTVTELLYLGILQQLSVHWAILEYQVGFDGSHMKDISKVEGSTDRS